MNLAAVRAPPIDPAPHQGAVTKGRLTRRDAARHLRPDADPLRAHGRLTRTALVRMSPADPRRTPRGGASGA